MGAQTPLPQDSPAGSNAAKRILRRTARVAAALAAFSIALTVLFRFVDPPFTPLMVLRALDRRAEGLPTGIEARPVALDRVSPAMLRAVIAAEDARFLHHHGIDLAAVRRASEWNERHAGKHLRGASTITMQCARNVFLWPGRTWLRKGLEVWFTSLIELAWGKRRILEVYLDVAEWGDAVYGVEAAARRWFGVSARSLDPAQSALLAAMLPAPRTSDPRAPSPRLRALAARIARGAPRVDLRPLGLAGTT
ncbi:MAG: monofunctional biosynthetic peptidoglycan transglycosylase [Deltaproteobacteria bacterium]